MTTLISPLSILCFGAGAIGSYVGGSLAASGNRVVFMERSEAVRSLRNTGITVLTSNGPLVVTNPVLVSSLSEAVDLGPFDVALVAIKSFDTPTLAESLKPFATQLPPCLSLQNGIENEDILAAALGRDQVIAGTVTTAISRQQPGFVSVERLRGIGIALDHPIVPHVIGAMNAAGLQARPYSQAGSLKWSKLLTNLLSNSTSAILDLPPSAIFTHSGLYRLEVAQIREALAVMRSLDLGVVNLPDTPVKLLAFTMGFLPPSLSRPLIWRGVGKGRGTKMPSLHIDLVAGRLQSEVEVLNGAVVRFGERQGIPTPANRLLTQILTGLVSGEQPHATYQHQPERLLEAWQSVNG